MSSNQLYFGSQRPRVIKEMQDKHWDVLELMLEGWKKSDIAVRVGLSPGMVTMITLSPLFIQELAAAKCRGDVGAVKSYLQHHAIDAASTTVELLTSEDEKVRLSAAKDILDRAGVTRELVVRTEMVLKTEDMSDYELARVVMARMEAKKKKDMAEAVKDVKPVIDVEGNEEPLMIEAPEIGLTLDMSELQEVAR